MPGGPPPAKSSNGCLKVFLILLAIGAVVGVIFVGLLAFGLFKLSEVADEYVGRAEDMQRINEETGISTTSLNTRFPPQYDITLDDCRFEDDRIVATGEIRNKSPEESSYWAAISFRDSDGNDVSTGVVVADRLDENEVESWVVSTGSPTAETCKIVHIDRWASDTIAPSTTLP